jgi:putative ABC transport system permease protein
MIIYVLLNMWRRKARTVLTVLGIVVGIFALTVLGGLSARLNQQVKGARSWFTNSISVVPSGGSLFGGGEKFLELSKVDRIGAVSGVQCAVPGIGVLLKDSAGFSFGAPDLVIGLGLECGPELLKQLKLSGGRSLQTGDSGKVALGATLALKLNSRVGKQVLLRGVPFEVVGIFETTLSAPDNFAFISYPDALKLFRAANPFIRTNEDIVSVVYVRWNKQVDPEALSADIAAKVPGVGVISPRDAEKQISKFSLIFNAILFGVALIALIVGGLSIINTMVMSVSERTREIGLKKAVGAETRTILLEYLTESAVIGFIGGLIGMGFGVLTIALINNATKANQVTVFGLTPMVIIGPVVFGTVLGGLAGIFPALRAARLRPVDSLKED